MDLWVVAAAAGAGYVAKANYLKNSTSKSIESSLGTSYCEIHSSSGSGSGSGESRNLLQRIRERTCPLCRLATLQGEAEFQNYGIKKRKEFTIEESLVMTSGRKLSKGKQPNRRSDSGYVFHFKPLDYLEYSWGDNFNTDQSISAEGSLYDSLQSPSSENMEVIPSSSTRGSSNIDMHIFLLGMSIGMLSNIGDHRREIDHLNEVLKESEMLVQDLHHQLEIKDHLSAKQVSNEDSDLDRDSFLYGKGNHESDEEKAAKNVEAMCEIEAELEAELERLELNLKSSSLRRTLSSFQENDAADNINDQPGIFYNSSEPSTQTETQAVSAKELSLRLHKVIESRLEARIIELQAALKDSHKRLQALALESQSIIPQSDLLDEVSFEEFTTSKETDDEVTLPDIQ